MRRERMGREHRGCKRLLAEPFEQRVLLNSSISVAAQTAIASGMPGLAAWMGSLTAYAQFNQRLPLIQKSTAEALAIETALNDHVAQPITNYLDTDATPTVDELRAVIEGLDVAAGDLVITSVVTNAGQYTMPWGPELRFDMSLLVQRTVPFAVDLGVASTDGIRIDATVDGTASTTFALSIGVDLTNGLSRVTRSSSAQVACVPRLMSI